MNFTQYKTLQIQWLTPSILLAIGRTLGSNSTLFMDNGNAILIDATGSAEDAKSLAELVLKELALNVTHVVITHYFSDHLAALRYFPKAVVIAHHSFQATFDAEVNRTKEEKEFFRKPTYLVDESLELDAGPITLNIFHNPGYTDCMLNVDIPELDAVHGGDTAVGNLVFLPYANITQLQTALKKLMDLKRSKVILSHGSVFPQLVLKNALGYLDSFMEKAKNWAVSGRAIPFGFSLESCLFPGAHFTDQELQYHERNLFHVRDAFQRLMP